MTLNCFVSGNPAVSFVFWTVTRNGFTQNAQDSRYSNGDINNPSLTINNARQSDTGVFICKAQNSAGTTDSSPISLTVSGSKYNDLLLCFPACLFVMTAKNAMLMVFAFYYF